MKNNEIHVSSFSNFIVRIFVIGYKNEGESNVILFFDGNNVVFSMLVDCFKKDNLNVASDLLKKYGVKKLDIAFWTHPHDDHSPGFDDIVSDFLSSKTIVYFPRFEFPNFNPQILKSCCVAAQRVSNNLEQINKKRSKKNPLLRRVDVNPGDNYSRDFILIDDATHKTKEFIIRFLTPIRPYIEQFGFQGCPEKLTDINELSISFTMSLDSYIFYFGGDAEKKHVNLIEPTEIAKMRWVKVPHHCSENSKKITRYLTKNFNCAASTVYSPQLPKVNIQNEYKKKGRLFMTQLDGRPNLNDYGIVEFDYRFEKDRIIISPILYGNAYEY